MKKWQKQNYRDELTVKLKNAVMVHWLKIKTLRKKPSINDILQTIIAKKREEKMNPNRKKIKEERKKRKKKQ